MFRHRQGRASRRCTTGIARHLIISTRRSNRTAVNIQYTSANLHTSVTLKRSAVVDVSSSIARKIQRMFGDINRTIYGNLVGILSNVSVDSYAIFASNCSAESQGRAIAALVKCNGKTCIIIYAACCAYLHTIVNRDLGTIIDPNRASACCTRHLDGAVCNRHVTIDVQHKPACTAKLITTQVNFCNLGRSFLVDYLSSRQYHIISQRNNAVCICLRQICARRPAHAAQSQRHDQCQYGCQYLFHC